MGIVAAGLTVEIALVYTIYRCSNSPFVPFSSAQLILCNVTQVSVPYIAEWVRKEKAFFFLVVSNFARFSVWANHLRDSARHIMGGVCGSSICAHLLEQGRRILQLRRLSSRLSSRMKMFLELSFFPSFFNSLLLLLVSIICPASSSRTCPALCSKIKD